MINAMEEVMQGMENKEGRCLKWGGQGRPF